MRPEDRDAACLWDIAEAARLVVRIVSDLDRAAFREDLDAVWETAASALPALVPKIEALLPKR